MERNISMWKKRPCVRKISVSCLSHLPQLGDWATTQACVLTRNWTSDLLLCGTTFNQLSHTGQGSKSSFNSIKLHYGTSHWHYFLSWIGWCILTQIHFYLSYWSVCKDFHQDLIKYRNFLSNITIFKQLFIKTTYVMGIKIQSGVR